MKATNPTTDRRQARIRNKVHHMIDLFRMHGALSKSQAKQRSGYAMSTVLAVFDQLRRQRLIVPVRANGASADHDARGPKPTLFVLNARRRLYLGITFTQSGIYSAIVSFSGEVLWSRAEILDLAGNERRFLDRFHAHLETIRTENAALLPALAWAGLSLPGVVDKDRGVLRSYTFMPFLKDVDFKSIVAGHFPGIEIQGDQNITGYLSCLLMDHELIRAHPLILFVSLRSGVASGIISQGRILTPIGEIGHVTVSDEPRRCVCGRRGCLDLHLSHQGLSNELISAMRSGGGRPRQTFLTIPEIIKAYRGDPALAAIVDRAFACLARAMVSAANLLAPDLIVISGELFECFDDPAAALRRCARDASDDGGFIRNFSNAELLYRAMGTEASAIGLCYNRIHHDYAYQGEEDQR